MTDKRCISCEHWEGNRRRAVELAKNPRAMHLTDGWMNCGSCDLSYNWLELDVDGDASVATEVAANFGCVYWSKLL